MQGLDNPHSGPPRPVEFAGGGNLELDGQVAQLNGAQSAIGMNHHLCGHSIRQPQVVGGADAIDQSSYLISPADCIDDTTVVWGRRLASQGIVASLVVETPVSDRFDTPLPEPVGRISPKGVTRHFPMQYRRAREAAANADVGLRCANATYAERY